ncbi:MAG TPA: hypothetical protein VEW91_03170 [bacterium]|nr:hypothetical protein [bacterium]
MRRVRGVALAAALVLSTPVWGAAPAGGWIQGRVIDRTRPQHPVAHQRVRLTMIERGASSEQEAVTDASGVVRFTRLPVGGIRVFVLSTDYRSVRYTSDRIVLADTAPARPVDLAVYEPSPDRSKVRAPVAFAVVDIARRTIRVSVIQRFENPTDRAMVGSPETPWVFPLPPGAGSVSYLAGWQDPQTGRGRITDVLTLLPGTAQVAYSYQLEARESRLVLPWSLPYGAGDVEVLVADAGVGVAAEGLRAQGMVAGPQGGRYQRWSGGPVAPGGEVVLRLRGVPVGGKAWPGVVAAGLGLILGVGLAAALRRSKRPAV